MAGIGRPVEFLRGLFDAAVTAVAPETCVPAYLPPPPKGRTVVIGFGKAAAAMARAVESRWDAPLSGVVVTRYGHDVTGLKRIRVIEARHPVPDSQGVAAATAILDAVRGLTADDLVLCLVSGGGSSLLVRPAAGVTLADKQALTGALLKSGAAIGEINTVRKHLSGIKGGRLALACSPAPIVNLVISDVPGDDPAMVASGPTIPDRSHASDALAILAKYRIAVPETCGAHLAAVAVLERTDPSPAFPPIATHLVATAQTALDAAAAASLKAGVTPIVLGGEIEGDAETVARLHAAIARQIARQDQPAPAPAVILSGGETEVTVTGNGRGGRNTQFLLGLAIALGRHPRCWAIAGDTDGIDGTEDNAGAIVTPDTLVRAESLNVDPAAHLADHDAWSFFAALGDLVVTGPTRTNVNDFRAVLVTPAQ